MRVLLNKSKQQFKKTINSMIDAEILEWPPACHFIFSQPERPHSVPKDYLEIIKIDNE